MAGDPRECLRRALRLAKLTPSWTRFVALALPMVLCGCRKASMRTERGRMPETTSPNPAGFVLTDCALAVLPSGGLDDAVLRIVSRTEASEDGANGGVFAVIDLTREDVERIMRLGTVCRDSVEDGALLGTLPTTRPILYGPRHPWVDDTSGDVIVPGDWIDRPLVDDARIPLSGSCVFVYADFRGSDRAFACFEMSHDAGGGVSRTDGIALSDIVGGPALPGRRLGGRNRCFVAPDFAPLILAALRLYQHVGAGRDINQLPHGIRDIVSEAERSFTDEDIDELCESLTCGD